MNRIKELREARGLSLQALADLVSASSVKTSAQQMHKLEKGYTRLTVDWMMRIGRALGVDPKDLIPNERQDSTENRSGGNGNLPSLGAIYRGSPLLGSERTLPILGRARGSTIGSFQMPQDQSPVGWTYRPGQLDGVDDAYAVLVYDDSMAPMYRNGQIAFVHPWIGKRAGDGVVVVKRNDEAIIKELVSISDTVIRLRAVATGDTFELPVDQVRSVHRIIGAIDPVL